VHLLYVDLLGSAARWRRGGAAAALAAFAAFERAAIDAVGSVPAASVLWAGIESDSLAVIFGPPVDAVTSARKLYLDCFMARGAQADDRLWLRGVVVPWEENPADLRRQQEIAPRFLAFRYAASFAEAISVERSGVKGMRLLISDRVVTPALRTALRIPLGGQTFIPFRKLTYSPYPARIADLFRDVLWMASADQVVWDQRKRAMERRLRWSASDPEEFAQAAATHLVFVETQAILAGLMRGGRAASFPFTP
jgi:hypothetical protein